MELKKYYWVLFKNEIENFGFCIDIHPFDHPMAGQALLLNWKEISLEEYQKWMNPIWRKDDEDNEKKEVPK